MVISGHQVAEKIQRKLIEEVGILKQKGVSPRLDVVLVGENPASLSYVNAKKKLAEKLGIIVVIHHFFEVTQAEILDCIQKLNHLISAHGIIVQMPLPEHLDANEILLSLNPAKDVDGFHPVNIGKNVLGIPALTPCTPLGIIEILKYIQVSPQGKHVVIVGRSNIVGKPLANLLLQNGEWADATLTVCHSKTKDVASFTRQADILIVAIGKPQFITGDMVKEGAVVIDVGISRVGCAEPDSEKEYILLGDVDFETVKQKASFITPVPGGVGPMTVTMLMQNVLLSAFQTL